MHFKGDKRVGGLRGETARGTVKRFGIANREHFDAQLKRAIGEADSKNQPLSLMLMEIDYIKAFNEQHGREAVDMVQKLIAQTFAKWARLHDIPAQYGEEEFAVLLLGSDRRDALVLGEKIRRMIGYRKLINHATGEPIGKITLSIGVACREPGESLDGFVGLAEAALSIAKSTGRNRMVSDHAAARFATMAS